MQYMNFTSIKYFILIFIIFIHQMELKCSSLEKSIVADALIMVIFYTTS